MVELLIVITMVGLAAAPLLGLFRGTTERSRVSAHEQLVHTSLLESLCRAESLLYASRFSTTHEGTQSNTRQLTWGDTPVVLEEILRIERCDPAVGLWKLVVTATWKRPGRKGSTEKHTVLTRLIADPMGRFAQ